MVDSSVVLVDQSGNNVQHTTEVASLTLIIPSQSWPTSPVT